MEILGVGPLELIVILLLAMMIFGPDRLPEIGAKLGRGMRAMRRATREFSQEVEQARQAIESPAREVAQPFRDIAPAVQAAAHPQDALRKAVLDQFAEAKRTDAQTASEQTPAEGAATPTYREILESAGADLGQPPEALEPVVGEDGSVQLPLDGLLLEAAAEPAPGPVPNLTEEGVPVAPDDTGSPGVPASGTNGSSASSGSLTSADDAVAEPGAAAAGSIGPATSTPQPAAPPAPSGQPDAEE